MGKKKAWTKEDYAREADEFVGCYGIDYCWDEFLYEYVSGWEHDTLKAPDTDLLRSAIFKAEDAEKAKKKSATKR